MATPWPTPGVTPSPWGQQLIDAIESRDDELRDEAAANLNARFTTPATTTWAGVQEVRRGGSAMRRLVRTDNPVDAKGWQEAIANITGDYSLELINDDGSWRSSGFAVYRDGRGIYGGVSYLKGTGSPEGAVSAPVGSRYVDVNATNGARAWHKNAGGGNTGWVVADGDTGIRNITSLWPQISQGTVVLRRVGNVCSIEIESVNFTDAAIGTAYASSVAFTGFRPMRDTIVPVGAFFPAGSPTWHQLRVPWDGMFAMALTSRVDLPIRGAHTWITRDGWPTTLPGTPA